MQYVYVINFFFLLLLLLRLVRFTTTSSRVVLFEPILKRLRYDVKLSFLPSFEAHDALGKFGFHSLFNKTKNLDFQAHILVGATPFYTQLELWTIRVKKPWAPSFARQYAIALTSLYITRVIWRNELRCFQASFQIMGTFQWIFDHNQWTTQPPPEKISHNFNKFKILKLLHQL